MGILDIVVDVGHKKDEDHQQNENKSAQDSRSYTPKVHRNKRTEVTVEIYRVDDTKIRV
jgi:hypothetical protein